jgi:hypothetical protein
MFARTFAENIYILIAGHGGNLGATMHIPVEIFKRPLLKSKFCLTGLTLRPWFVVTH